VFKRYFSFNGSWIMGNGDLIFDTRYSGMVDVCVNRGLDMRRFAFPHFGRAAHREEHLASATLAYCDSPGSGRKLAAKSGFLPMIQSEQLLKIFISNAV
jgi:hypothetical protein